MPAKNFPKLKDFFSIKQEGEKEEIFYFCREEEIDVNN